MEPGSRGQNLTSKPDPGVPGGVSWGVGNGGVHETESGTSHITLHQPDTRMLLSSWRSSAGKGTGPDSSPAERSATPAPHNVSRDGRPPKRPGPQSAVPPPPPPRRALAPARGDLTLGM